MSKSNEYNDEESASGISSHDTDLAGSKQSPSNERKTLARNETRAVGLLRGAVLLVLVTTASLSSYFAYRYVIFDEKQDFQRQFTSSAKKVIESFNLAVERKLGALDMLSVTFTSYASANGLKFPFVTLPDYEVRGANARVVAGGFRMDWLPLVTKEKRSDWESYSLKHHDWYNRADVSDAEFRDLQDEKFGLNQDRKLNQAAVNHADVHSGNFNPRIFGVLGSDDDGPGPFLPFWQVTPIVPSRMSFLNFNLLSVPQAGSMLRASLESKQAVLGMARELEDPNKPGVDGISKVFLGDIMVGQYRHSLQKFVGDPTTNLAYPVFDGFKPNRTVVGILRTSLFWRLHFSDILPEGINGIICVLENNMNQSFTYRLDGPNVSFLGPGDRHDTHYDDIGVSQDVASYVEEKAGPETWSYTQVDLNTKYSKYTLRVYPSNDMEVQYVTDMSTFCAIGVACIFLFTTVVFICYDWMVERRQNVVMDRAVASGAIVSSLFPETVRDRLLEENNDKKTEVGKHHGMTWKSLNENQNNCFTTLMGTTGDSDHIVDTSSNPIADLFPSTTIMFGDIVGFTNWASNKEPKQVFELLENLYGAFDAIARRRGVFKVETIGDCYVAVTGLPTPREDHAVALTKFAQDCMVKMNEVTSRLKDSLGDDTALLNMRVGLHSGPVTAGVLRGQKARFQLFGDTMNTASRMETTGRPGHIHISKETAHELSQKGKTHWLVPREEKVVAKGKGELKTYWVHFKTERTVTSVNLSDTSKSG